MNPPRCDCCGGEPEIAGGLASCPACGLVSMEKKHLAAAVYVSGLESGIYGSSKRWIFKAALDTLEELPQGRGRLLDVGCASGEFMKAALARGWQPEGVEIDPVLSARATLAGFRVHARLDDERLLEGWGYGAVTAFEVLSQMAAPDTAVREIFRLLAPGGLFYVREFNASFHLALYRLESAGFFKPLGASPAVLHNFNFTPATLRVMLERAGFRDIQINNSRPTAGDPYHTGGLLGGFFTGILKVLYYYLAQAVLLLSFGRLYAGSSLIVTARK